MDERLRELLQELGNAINESLTGSDRIAEAIGNIKRAGYDVFLVLEVTIGFAKREFDEEDENGSEGLDESTTLPHAIKFTTQDRKFLRAIKIATDEPK